MYLKHLMYHYMQAKHYLTGITNIIFLQILRFHDYGLWEYFTVKF